jgi:uncharacterized membrane protein
MIAVLAALWKFTPLHNFVNSDHLQEFGRSHLMHQWWAILLIVPVYIVGSLLMFPNLALNIAVILSIGGWLVFTECVPLPPRVGDRRRGVPAPSEGL